MCIICGSQCGVAEFLISMGLPFLGLYFYRIRDSLRKIKNIILRRVSGAEELLNKTIKPSGCGELLKDCRGISTQSIEPENLELIKVKSRSNESTGNSTWINKFRKLINLEKKGELKGVRGWLLLLCLNLTIFIPASCFYEVMSTLYSFNSFIYQIMLIVSNQLLLHNIAIIAIMGFLATLSFYAGLQLWEVKPGAVKIAKIFLIIQLSLTFIVAAIRLFIIFPIVASEHSFSVIIKILIPSLLHFSLWYLYLSKSRRVHNTYSNGEREKIIPGQLPAKLTGYTEFT